MATQRYISTSFWDDAWIHRLDPSEKLLFLYLMTNPLTNIAGIYKTSVDRMIFDTGFNEHTVKHILEKFEKSGKVIVSGEYIIIPSWPKHQKVGESPKIKAGIDLILAGVPKDVLSCARERKYAYNLDSLLIGYEYRSNYSDLDSDRDLDSDTNVGSGPNPKQPRSKAPAVNDPLLRPILDSFLSEGNFANYQKETVCAKAIIKSVRNLSPDNPEKAAELLLVTFRQLVHGTDKFWSGQPFLPSGLSPLVERVWAEAIKTHRVQDTGWLERLRNGQS